VAAGAVDHARLVKDAEARFEAFVPDQVDRPAAGRFAAGTAGTERDMEQVHLALALPGRGATHPDRRSFQIFAHILGGGMSSRLFHEAREKRGLCYAIGSSHTEWSDTGLFVIYAATDPERVKDLVEVVRDVVNDAVANINEPEVNRAKAQFKAGMLMAMETADARASSLAEDLLVRGRPISIAETAAGVDAVTVDGVRAAGREMLEASAPAVSILGPEAGIANAKQAGIATLRAA
jgi:predicted Zn-dependent peptidase